MKKTRKILALVLVVVMLLAMCVSCGKKDDDAGSKGSDAGKATSSPNGSSTTPSGEVGTGSVKTDEGKVDADFAVSETDIGPVREKARKATKQVEKVVAVMGSGSYDPAPFGATGGHETLQPFLYANLCEMPDYGASIDELEMNIAKSVDWNKDTKLLKVEIWDYITDSQGNKIDTSDVKYSYEYTRDEAATCQGCSTVNNDLVSIKVIDDYNIEFQLVDTIGPGQVEDFLTIVEIIDEGWHSTASAEDKTSNPACTGAYTIKSFVAGSDISLVANDNYWQKDVSLRCTSALQNVKEIYYQVITEAAMRCIALENDEVDYSNVDATNIYRFMNVETGEAKEGYTVMSRFGNHNKVWMYNNDDGSTSGINSMFNNQKLRQAFATAVDNYQASIGFGNTETSFVLTQDTGMPGASDWQDKWYEEEWYPYDVDKALELLKESGHSKEENLQIRFLAQNNTTNVAGCAVLQAFWSELGAETSINAYDQALFNTYKFNSAEWDIITDSKPNGYGICPLGWSDIFDPGAYENGGACFTHDEKLVQLLTDAISIHSDEAVDAFHQYQMTMCYEYPLYCAYSYYVTQDSIEGMWLQCNAYKAAPMFNAFVYADDYVSVAA